MVNRPLSQKDRVPGSLASCCVLWVIAILELFLVSSPVRPRSISPTRHQSQAMQRCLLAAGAKLGHHTGPKCLSWIHLSVRQRASSKIVSTSLFVQSSTAPGCGPDRKSAPQAKSLTRKQVSQQDQGCASVGLWCPRAGSRLRTPGESLQSRETWIHALPLVSGAK